MKLHIRSILWICSLASFATGCRSTSSANSEQKSSPILTSPVPAEDFSYSCRIRMEDQSATTKRWFSEGQIEVKKHDIKERNIITIPRTAWTKVGTYNPRDSEEAPQYYENKAPPFSLDHHFLTLTVFENAAKIWQVSLRANIIFKENAGGSAAFATADYASKRIGTRIVATNPSSSEESETLDLRVDCTKALAAK